MAVPKGDFDDLLNILGLGKWNWLYYIALGICWAALPGFYYTGGFIAPRIEYKCDITDDNITFVSDDQCSYKVVDNTTSGYFAEEIQCSDWIYDTSDYGTTLTEEFNLVCNKAYLRPVYQTIFMAGSFIGTPLNGFLADRFGRKKVLTITSVISILSFFLSTFCSNFTAILILRFLTGLTTSTIFHTGFILCMEICEPKLRSVVGILLSLPWAFGTMWWGALGYWIRDWRWLLRATTAPTILYFICLCFMDESPRWLIVRGQHQLATKYLRKAARWNNVSLPPDEELSQRMKIIEHLSSGKTNQGEITEKKSPAKSPKIKRVFRRIIILYKTPEIRKRVLLIYVVFMVSSTVFYGMSLNSVNFDLDPYMYMIVGGLMEVPAYILPIPIIAKIGRIPPTSFSYFFCGFAILAMAFIPSDIEWLLITAAMVGKFFISAAFQIVYLLASEVLPTEVRMQGLGTSSFLSSFGAFATPFITDLLGGLYYWLPSAIFGALSLTSGVASLFFPETLNKHLPETVQQLEAETLMKRLSATKGKRQHRRDEEENETFEIVQK